MRITRSAPAPGPSTSCGEQVLHTMHYPVSTSCQELHCRHAGVPVYRKTPIHLVARKQFPPLFGVRKARFLQRASSFIIARDPFERLLSSYRDKVAVKSILPFLLVAPDRCAVPARSLHLADIRPGPAGDTQELQKPGRLTLVEIRA